MELTPIEDVSLQSGSGITQPQPQPDAQPVEGTVAEDGTIIPPQTPQMNMCPHNAEFFANPDWEAIVNGQRAELDQRNAEAAAAAAAAAAQQAAEQQQQQPPAEQPAQ